ncbi:MAG: hypothetical protein ACLQBX_03595 [Candidatus Limnocylindrales bacterium]
MKQELFREFFEPAAEFQVWPERVTRVLLADGWHDIEAGSFAIDFRFGYSEPLEEDEAELDTELDLHRERDLSFSSVTERGFVFSEAGALVTGPRAAIIAVVSRTQEELEAVAHQHRVDVAAYRASQEEKSGHAS